MSDGRLLIQVIGLQRSGNHAIIRWLESLFARPLHLNDLEHDYLAGGRDRTMSLEPAQARAWTC